MAYLVLIIALLAIDLGIKEEIEEREPEFFPKSLDKKGIITLQKYHNTGFSFGFLKKYPEVVKFIPVAVISGLFGILFWLMPKKGYFLEKTALSFTLGGALSNLYDRFVRRYVVDYFTIEWRWLKKVVFNLGDMFIFLGSALMLLHEIIVSLKSGK